MCRHPGTATDGAGIQGVQATGGARAFLHVAPALTSLAVVGRHACQHRKIARLRQQFARLERFASCPAHACAHGEERDRVGALWLDYVQVPLGTRERPVSAQRIRVGLAGLPAPPPHRFVGRGHRDVAGLITERAVTAGEPARAGDHPRREALAGGGRRGERLSRPARGGARRQGAPLR